MSYRPSNAAGNRGTAVADVPDKSAEDADGLAARVAALEQTVMALQKAVVALQATTETPSPQPLPPWGLALQRHVASLDAVIRRQLVTDRELVQAIFQAWGTAVFSAAEVFRHRTVDHRLRAALRNYRNAKQLGERLHVLKNVPLDGYVVTRVGRDNRGTVWHVTPDADLHHGPCLDGSDGTQ